MTGSAVIRVCVLLSTRFAIRHNCTKNSLANHMPRMYVRTACIRLGFNSLGTIRSLYSTNAIHHEH